MTKTFLLLLFLNLNFLFSSEAQILPLRDRAVTGDYPLHENTAYAIELNTTVYVAAWNGDIRIMLEEPGFFGKNGFRYIDNRQERIYVINAN